MQLAARARALDFYGKVLCFFLLSSVMTYFIAGRNLWYSSDPTHKVELDLFTYILPFVSFIIDAAVKRAYNIQVKSGFMAVKVMMIFFYLAVYVCALQATVDEAFYWIVNANLILFPILMIGYLILLLNGKLS